MRIAVIINPFAGRGRRGPVGEIRARLVDALVRRHGVEAEVFVTRGPGHGAELSRASVEAGCDVVAAWGGDGTINEVAGPLIGSRSALAVVPAGSGDGLARGLGLPASPDRAFALAVSGQSAAMDVGFIGDRHFLNIAGIGFDAAVAVGFSRSGRYGAISYTNQAFRGLWSYRCAEYAVVLDGAPSAGRRFAVVFANSGQYGNGLVIAPDADPRDGLLNVVVAADGSPLRQLWRARRLFVRKLAPTHGVLRTRVRTASVSGDALLCHVDGEPFRAAGTLDVRVEPGALRVVGPAAGG